MGEETTILGSEFQALGLYEVLTDPIKGGMGSVWRIRHSGWGADLACKQLHEHLFTDESQKLLFKNECETWIGLGLHPHIVSCYYVMDVGENLAVFSEWMDGGSLADSIRNGRLYEGSRHDALERVLDIAIQFARGLQYAHERGIVHQDVKPGNVFLTADGEAKVSDFGIAQARGATVFGSGAYPSAYCSPEQVDGAPLTRRTDIYSWAVSVLEMFLGERLWPSGSAVGQAFEEYATRDLKVEMPEGVHNLLHMCLATDPQKRPDDFKTIISVLKLVYRGVVGENYGRSLPTEASLAAGYLNNKALSFLDLGHDDRAESAWEEALVVDPAHTKSLINRAIFRWRRGVIGVDQCTSTIENCYASDECDDNAYLLAQFFLESGDRTNALSYLRKVKNKAAFPDIKQLRAKVNEIPVPRIIASVESILGTLDEGRLFYDTISGENGDRTVLFDSETFEHRFDFGRAIHAFSDDGKLALHSKLWSNHVEVLDATTGERVQTFDLGGNWQELAFAKDSRQVVMLMKDATVATFGVFNGKCLSKTGPIKERLDYGAWCLSPHFEHIVSMEPFMPCTLMSIKGMEIKAIEGNFSLPIRKPVFSQDDSLLLMPDHNICRLYDTETGECLKKIAYEFDWAHFSRNREYVVAVKRRESRKYIASLIAVFEGRILSSFDTDFCPSGIYDTDAGVHVISYNEKYSFTTRDDFKKKHIQIVTFPAQRHRVPYVLSKVASTS